MEFGLDSVSQKVLREHREELERRRVEKFKRPYDFLRTTVTAEASTKGVSKITEANFEGEHYGITLTRSLRVSGSVKERGVTHVELRVVAEMTARLGRDHSYEFNEAGTIFLILDLWGDRAEEQTNTRHTIAVATPTDGVVDMGFKDANAEYALDWDAQFYVAGLIEEAFTDYPRA